MYVLYIILTGPYMYREAGYELTLDLDHATGWNGTAVFLVAAASTIDVTSDTSGHWGCGAWSQHSWFQFEWPETARHHHITFKELCAILMACAIWGKWWHSARVRC